MHFLRSIPSPELIKFREDQIYCWTHKEERDVVNKYKSNKM